MFNPLLWQIVALVLIIVMGILHRGQWLSFRPFAMILTISLLLWLFCAAFVLIKAALIVWHQNLGTISMAQWLAILMAFIIVTSVGVLLHWGRSVPAIHDISTDLDNPPELFEALALRQPHHNPITSSAAVAEKQRQAYPYIKPLRVQFPPDSVFSKAIEEAAEMGWEVHARSLEDGRIEATVTSQLLGFVDDVVIRVSQREEGSQVDVRSVSRVGKSDLGANAKRIDLFLKRLQQRLESSQ